MKTNKLPMIQLLVATGDQRLPSGTTFASSSTALNLSDGQIGVLAWDPNAPVRTMGTYLTPGDDPTDTQAIKIVQGTANSSNVQLANPWQVGEPTHVESAVIKHNQIDSVYVKKAAYATYGAQACTSFPTPVDNGVYNAFLTLDSVRDEKTYGVTNDNSIYSDVPLVADFTTITSPLDYVLTHLMCNFNSQSRAVRSNTRQGNQPFVIFGVKVGGGSGQALGTITASTSLTFQTVDGVDQKLTSSPELCQALAQLVQDSALTNSSTIEDVDITTAGAAAKIDALVVIGLPHNLAAYYDNVPQTMVFPKINFGASFLLGTDPTVVTCNPKEGHGHTRRWKIWNDNRQQLNIHTKQNTPFMDWFSEGYTYIDPAKDFYTSYIIEHNHEERVLTGTINSPMKTVLLFRCEPQSSFTLNVANIVTRIAAGSTPVPFVTSDDAGTGTASTLVVAGIEASLTAWLEASRVAGKGFAVGADAAAAGTYLS